MRAIPSNFLTCVFEFVDNNQIKPNGAQYMQLIIAQFRSTLSLKNQFKLWWWHTINWILLTFQSKILRKLKLNLTFHYIIFIYSMMITRKLWHRETTLKRRKRKQSLCAILHKGIPIGNLYYYCWELVLSKHKQIL